MKCKEAEISILLQDSGELTHVRSRKLASHLDECESCRSFNRMMLESKTACAAVIEPSAKLMQDVMRTARVCAPVKKRIAFHGLKPALAMAASFVVIVGVLFGNYAHDQRVGMELVVTDAQMLDPADQVVSIMYDGLSEDDLAFHFLMTYQGDNES